MSNKNQTSTQSITVFYDGACGLCAKEIAHYKKISPAGIFSWVDIADNSQALEDLGYTRDDGLRALHVIGRDGNMYIGVAAFIQIWMELKRWSVLAKVIQIPGIYHTAQFLYKSFAAWRFKKLGYGVCTPR